METKLSRGNSFLDTMEGQVLRENSKMLELVASLGFQVRNDEEDNTIKQVEARLQ